MTEALVWVSVVFLWLAIGGWAFGRFVSDPKHTTTGDEIMGLVLFSLLLAPFAAGVALVTIKT